MGNSQFNSAKDGEGGSGREGDGFSSYPETRTTPGAPGPFSDAEFAPSMRQGDGTRHAYAGVATAGNAGLGGSGASAGPRASGGAADDAMDVESKVEEVEEEEVRANNQKTKKCLWASYIVLSCRSKRVCCIN